MADLPIPRHQLTEPNVRIRRLWLEQQIQEKKNRAKRLRLDAEEILLVQTKRIEAAILVLEREAAHLEGKLDALDQFGAEEVIDIKQIEAKGA
jgi:hypothetical protein